MPKEESIDMEEPPSADSLQNQEGPTFSRSLNKIIHRQRRFRM